MSNLHKVVEAVARLEHELNKLSCDGGCLTEIKVSDQTYRVLKHFVRVELTKIKVSPFGLNVFDPEKDEVIEIRGVKVRKDT